MKFFKGEGVQYDYGFRIYDSRMARFLSVDPLTSSYPMLTPYQFAGNMPIAAIDLDGLEEEIKITTEETVTISRSALKTETAYTIFTGLTNTAEHLVDQLPNTGNLKYNIGLMNLLLTAGQISKNYDDTDHSDPSAVKKFQGKTSAALIGQTVAFYNPILGWAVGGLISNAVEPDGLTNLDNGRLATAYAQGDIQNKAGNYHYQKMLKEKEIEKKLEETNSQRFEEIKVVKWRQRKYVEYDVMGGDGKYHPYRIYEPSIFDANNSDHDMWRILTSYLNQPGKEAYNPTTKFGVELIPYEVTEKKEVKKP